MTRTTLFLIPALALTACAQDAAETAASADETTSEAASEAVVGTAPQAGDVIPAVQVVERAAALAGQTVRVEGTVAQVCRNKGCWLTLQTDGAPIRVVVPRDATSGEYAYTFPTDIGGGTAVLEGTLAVEETSVETLRHLAEDEGQSADQVAAITAPRREVVLTATGARLRRPAPTQA